MYMTVYMSNFPASYSINVVVVMVEKYEWMCVEVSVLHLSSMYYITVVIVIIIS